MKSKPVVKKVKFTAKEQNEIDLINKGERVPTIKTITDNKTGVKRDIVYNHKFSAGAGKTRLRRLYGGLCCVCGNWPDYNILYKKDGAKQIERYCSNCLKKFKEKIK